MKEFLNNILPRIKAYSKELDVTESIIDKPWVWINENSCEEKLIFRRGGSLLMVRNGSVNEGKWELIPSMKSLLIDRNSDKILMSYAFVDKSVILLKKGGIENEIIAFVNEMDIPNLDYSKYLESIAVSKPISKAIEDPKKDTNGGQKTYFWVTNLRTTEKVYVNAHINNTQFSANLYGLNWAFENKQKVYLEENEALLKDDFYKIPERYRDSNDEYYKALYFVHNGMVTGRYQPIPIEQTLAGQKVTVYRYNPLSWHPNDWKPESMKYALVLYKGTLTPFKSGKYSTNWFESWTISNGIITVDGWF